RRHAGQASGQGADIQQAVRGRGQAIPRRDPQASDDRVQVQMSDAAARPLALTLGEPAGIGPDLALAVWHRRRELDVPPFYLIGDADFLGQRARMLGLDIAIEAATPAAASRIFT